MAPTEIVPTLEARDVWHRYSRMRPWTLSNVQLVVPRGTILAMVGPNGAGKSTLIRSWVGFERPTKGSCRVNGFDLRSERRGALEQVAYVSQSGGLFGGLTVRDHVRLARTLRPSFDTTLAADWLERFRIPMQHRAGELSGGQVAHVKLALAFGMRAGAYLLDEPLASLDPLARREFLTALVDEVQARGATALLSSHIVRDIESACDSIAILSEGRIVLHDSVSGALGAHRVLETSVVNDVGAIAAFTRDDGRRWLLVQSADPSLESPTLEDLVIGYLAASRASQRGSGL